MLRMTSDLLPALIAARDGELGDFSLRWRSDAAVTVVMAAKGYPGTVVRNTEIRNLTAAASLKDVEIFHAGTRQDGDRLLADGGRVLAVTATGADIAAARDLAYRAVSRIDWPDGFCRSDIGAKAAD
jgi:phosphoribosylamine--glycine ligase